MRYFKKLVGERIYLSPINTDDAELYTKWLNDPEVSGFVGNYNQMITLHNEKKQLESMAETGQHFAIVKLEGDALIGNISLKDILNPVYRRAELGIFIGDAENQGRGYGAEAIRLLLGYGFKTLNLHCVVLYVHADNGRAIACYKKTGFRECAYLREAIFKCGRYVDVIGMDMLESEFAD